MPQIDKIGLGMGFLLSAGMTSLCAYAMVKGHQTAKWLKRSAKITESKVAAQKDSERYTTYAPRVKYEYQFNDAKHMGTEIYYKSSPLFNTEAEALAFLGKYPLGSTVEIRVNPGNPSQAVLIAGVVPRIGFLVLGGIFVMSVFAAIYLNLD